MDIARLRTLAICIGAVAIGSLGGCGAPAPDPAADGAPSTQGYVPGLHSLMVELQFRHANLWFSGDAENWALTDYQVHELEDLLERIPRLHPVYEDVPVASLIGSMTGGPVQALEAAVDARDGAAFRTAFDQLTRGCNGCHAATGHGAIVIQRPTAPPFTNLRFQPPAD